MEMKVEDSDLKKLCPSGKFVVVTEVQAYQGVTYPNAKQLAQWINEDNLVAGDRIFCATELRLKDIVKTAKSGCGCSV